MNRINKIIEFCVKNIENESKFNKGIASIEKIVNNYFDNDICCQYNNLIGGIEASISIAKYWQDIGYNDSYEDNLSQAIWDLRKIPNWVIEDIQKTSKNTGIPLSLIDLYQLISLISIDMNTLNFLTLYNNFKIIKNDKNYYIKDSNNNELNAVIQNNKIEKINKI